MKMREVGRLRYVMVDLLLDLIIYPDGRYHVLDIDEFADAIEKGHLKKKQQIYSLRTLDQMIRLQTERRLIPKFIQDAKMYPLTTSSRK
jgi:predicted RNA-binding protein associated with RNAse of E/G family